MYCTIIFVFSFCTLCLASNNFDNKEEISTTAFNDSQKVPILEELVNHFNLIARAEIDAYHSCRMAAEGIKDQEIKDALWQFQEDHKKNILAIETEIESFQNYPTKFDLNFKWFSTPGYICLLTLEDDISILQAVERNEYIIKSELDIILNEDIPSFLDRSSYKYGRSVRKSVDRLRKILKSDNEHLFYIRSKLSSLGRKGSVEGW